MAGLVVLGGYRLALRSGLNGREWPIVPRLGFGPANHEVEWKEDEGKESGFFSVYEGSV